jgi:hypothetical protein
MRKVILLGLVTMVVCGCSPSVAPTAEFEEVRIHRWTALEGGEILILRRVGTDWSAELQGDGSRFRCFYVRRVTPKSDWNSLWNALIQEGLMEISGSEPPSGWEDGDGFDVEIRSKGKTQRYGVDNPAHQPSENAKRTLRIGNLLSTEFETPMFAENYDRGKVGEYLYAPCKSN